MKNYFFVWSIFSTGLAAQAVAQLPSNENGVQAAQAARQREQTEIRMSASIQQQTAAVRMQARQKPLAGSHGEVPGQPAFFIMDAMISVAAAEPDCDSLSPMEIHRLATQAARSNHVSTDLIEAVIRQESGFRPCAVSSAGAQGLMQLMPDTATDLGVGDAFDPEQNVQGGAKLLRTLLDRYAGDLNRTLGAYNAGPARVDAANGIPPFPETITYVDRILRNLSEAASKTPTNPQP